MMKARQHYLICVGRRMRNDERKMTNDRLTRFECLLCVCVCNRLCVFIFEIH